MPELANLLAHVKIAAKQSLLLSIISLIIVAACFGTMVFIQAQTGTKFSNFIRDANAIAGQPFYFGGLEYASSAMMLMSSAIVFFVAATERLLTTSTSRFMWLFGLLTFLLGFDDLYMVHESVWAIHWRLGEIHVFAGYAVLLVILLAVYHRVLIRSPFFLFLFALALLGLGGLDDQFRISLLGIREDYLEFIGFSFWSTYAIATSALIKRRAFPSDKKQIDLV